MKKDTNKFFVTAKCSNYALQTINKFNL